MKLDWKKLLCDRRYSALPRAADYQKKYTPDQFRSQFEADYDRVIYSKAFRRLGKKTQVHPMEMNAHIHNRLTHSLEVASVGRTFARRLARFLFQRGELPCRCEGCDGDLRPSPLDTGRSLRPSPLDTGRSLRPCPQATDDLVQSLMAACLVHDIGNPPFGHAGEFAIREWAQRHAGEVFPDGFDDPGLRADVGTFEGNAQGFRLAARSDIPNSGHIRVTYCTLGAMVKYPWESTDPRATAKYNFFSSEIEIAKVVFGEMGLFDGDDFCRHPLSFLSEAADDICYRVIDIEDAVELGILSIDKAKKLYVLMLGETAPAGHAKMSLSQLRATVVGKLIGSFWDVFEADYDSIMEGQRTDDLKAGVPNWLKEALSQVKETNKKIFSTEKKIRLEIGAYKILGGILKALAKATLVYSQEHCINKVPFIAKRCLELAWDEQYLVDNAHQTYSWWLHEILDFISGLTDDHAYLIANAIGGVGQE